MKITSKKIFPVIMALGLFLPVFNAQADWFGIGSISYWAVSNMFAYVSYFMFSAVGTFMGWVVDLMYWAVNIRIYTNIPVIQDSWKIMRDFANMLFIIALVVMAYGTIFNISEYDFRSLITKFLIAALLINFSLVIGGLIIDGTQILNNTFLNAMGDISDKLGKGMEVGKLLPEVGKVQDNAEAFSALIFSSFITILFAMFLSITFLVSVSVPLVMALVRIPILWALLIVSPMAWLLSILPATRSVYDKWWHEFLAWTLFLPYYLFFLYFALYFLSRKNEVIAGLGQTFVNDQVTGMTGLQSDFTFGLIFYYLLIAIFMIGGTKVAMNAGRFSGTKIVGVAKWGRGQTMRYLSVTAAQRGAQQKLDEVKKEGLPGYGRYLYGGERGLEEQTARMAKRFGVKEADIKVQQGFLDRTGKEYEELETKNRLGQVSLDQIKKIADSGKATDAKVYAARKILAKTGQLNADISQKTFSELGNNALAMEDFAKTASGSKWSGMEKGSVIKIAQGGIFTDNRGKTYDYSNLRKSSNGIAARREAVKYIQNDKSSITDTTFDEPEIKEYISLMGGHTTHDSKEFINSVNKYRPDLVYKLSKDPAFSSLNSKNLSKTEFIQGAVDRADYETLAFMPLNVWGIPATSTTPSIPDPDFKAALLERYSRRKNQRDKDIFKTALLDELIKAPDSKDKTVILNDIIP